MAIYASKSRQGFYDDTIHSPLPADAVEIGSELHAALLVAQSAGQVIDWSGDLPVAVDPPPLTMAELRRQQLAAITAERYRREEAGFPYRGKLLDSTPRSVQRITAAALAAQVAAQAGQPFSIDWTAADNSVLSLDAAGMVGMPVALAQHAAALHAHARSLKAAVDAAMDGIALAEIDIQVGWPGGEV